MWVISFIFVAVAVVLYKLYCWLFPQKIINISPTLGQWAVVTGATDGIGKSFAQQLAGKGFNIVLVSRSLQRLTASAKEIEEKYSVATKIIQADFTSSDEPMYERIKCGLKDVEIGVLVNNVGMSSRPGRCFTELEQNQSHIFQDIINCNIASAVHMTKIVLPGMIARSKGLIINISSGLSLLPSPLLSMYGASKSFLTKFSEDLDTECRDKGVHIHVLTTGRVATKLSRDEMSSFYIPFPETYVRSALEEVAYRRSCSGYFPHTLQFACWKIGVILCPNYTAKYALKRRSNLR